MKILNQKRRKKQMPEQPEIFINHISKHVIPFSANDYAKEICNLKRISNGRFEFTFCDNNQIIEINKKYLNRTYATDIISFNLGNQDNLDADIYISIEQAIENCKELDHNVEDELKTLIIHGILHTLDYKDYTKEDKDIMFMEQDRLFELAKH